MNRTIYHANQQPYVEQGIFALFALIITKEIRTYLLILLLSFGSELFHNA